MLIISAFGVFAMWAVVAITLLGIGSAVLPLFSTDYHLGEAFWMGLAVALLEIWSLVARIDFTTAIGAGYPWLWLLLPSLAGVVFWFWASPDVRFAQFSIWTTAGILGTWGIVSIVREPQGARAGLAKSCGYPTNLAVAGLLALAVWCLAGFGWKEPYRRLLAEVGLSPLPKASVTARTTLCAGRRE